MWAVRAYIYFDHVTELQRPLGDLQITWTRVCGSCDLFQTSHRQRGRSFARAAVLSVSVWFQFVFTARRYASAILCRHPVSVRLSVISRYGIETTGPIELVLAWRHFPPIPHWVIQKSGYLIKNYGTSLRNFVRNSGLRKYCHGKSMPLSTKLVVVVDGRVCWRHIFDNRRVVAVYCKSVNCNPICCLFVVQLVSTVDKILTDITRRAVRLR